MSLGKYIVSLKKTASFCKKIFIYNNFNSADYWKKRPLSASGQARVLWLNESYNEQFRLLQRKILGEYLRNIESGLVLDIGCGIGAVSKILIDINPKLYVDAVDFEEMVQIAKKENYSSQINYISSAAEDYCDENKKYRVVISSCAFSAIRDITKMKKAIINCTKMIEDDGIIIMIDPLHSWSFLARVKFSVAKMVEFMDSLGFEVASRDGIIFWPYRVWLANSNRKPEYIKRKFAEGEKLLGRLGKHLWSDYKILIFRKKSIGRQT